MSGYELVLLNGKIYIPSVLREATVEWYHNNLCHPGSTVLHGTMAQTMAWPGMSMDIIKHTRTCTRCQIAKKAKLKYGHVPPKLAEITPWEVLCVDLVGPYTVTLSKGKTKKDDVTRSLLAMTFIDPATGWFEIQEIPDKLSKTTARTLDTVWLSRYPRPSKVIFDNGTEFIKDFRTIFASYGVTPQSTTIKNPQANGILERVHKVLGNMLRASNVKNLDIDFDSVRPFESLLSSVAYAVRSTYHTTLKATPCQLVYARDMVQPMEYVAEWDLIRKTKQKRINENNARENSKRVEYDYTVGQSVLLQSTDIRRKLDDPAAGPYKILQVHTNGNVTILRVQVIERVNIRRIKPFVDETSPPGIDIQSGGECSKSLE